jgi:hypothetical protein
MLRFSTPFSFILIVVTSTLFASPKIEVANPVFKCGIVFQGKVEKIKANFTVKNIGDAPLTINARPGCGCTLVKYDTLIAPGKTSIIESEVNISRFSSGPLSKHITITSNASNTPSLQLTIEATLQAIIDLSENYLNLIIDKSVMPHELFLYSLKKNLVVSAIAFKLTNSDVPEFKNVPISLKFSWLPTDSVRSDGYKIYKLSLIPPTISQSANGEFIIKTNHPDKPEIKINGTISKQ